MTALRPLPASELGPPEDLGAQLRADDLVYFCCNAGDADAQLLLLPDVGQDHRRAIIVDAGISGKIESLIDALVGTGLLPGDGAGDLVGDAIALVVATHPHDDHIRGIPGILERHGDHVVEFWDSGYWHPIRAFHDTMRQVEEHRHIVYAQPTSGTRRWIQDTRITVLAPAVSLKSRYDSYGVEINNASIALRIDYPAARVVHRNERRELLSRERTASLVLGGDAQHDSWAQVVHDFPSLQASSSAAARAIGAASGADHLSADVLKVSHHASKRGLSLEVVERIAPRLTIVSCADDSPRYNFPHRVAQELLREALQATGGRGTPRGEDYDLNLFYTADRDDAGAELGTIAVRMRPGRRDVWRLGDAADAGPIDLTAARPWRPRA